MPRHSRPHLRWRDCSRSTFAIRRCFVDTVMSTESHPCCPTTVPQPDRPLPYSQALPGGIRLLSIGTMRQLRLPSRVLPPPLPVGGQYPELTSRFRSLPPGSRRRKGQGVLNPTHLLSVVTLKDADGSHQFPGNPSVSLPCSRTPAGPPRQAIRRLGIAPAACDHEGSGDSVMSRLNHTALILAVYASCRHL